MQAIFVFGFLYLAYGSFSKLLIGILRAESINDPKSALQKPSTLKPGVRWLASINNNALMTRLKSPRVIILIGNVIRYTRGFRIALIKPIITIAIKADWIPET